MKTCLITGGGSKFGSKLTDQFLAAGYKVYLVTGSQTYLNNPMVTTILVDWKTLGLGDIKKIILSVPNLDLIFFNHNSSALSQPKFQKNQLQSLKDWQQSYFVACQFPFYLVHSLKDKISKTTKIGWMLSSLIKYPYPTQVGFADYVGNKSTNHCIMKAFSQSFPAIFFGINPDSVGKNSELDANKSQELVQLIESDIDLNGKIYCADGTIFDF